jgi:hypothetical protein
MSNQYSESMRTFFRSIDSSKEPDPEKLALAFANHFWSKSNWQHRHSGQKVILPQDSISNVSILARETPLSFLTKRAPLVADTTILTHYGEEAHVFYEYIDSPPGPEGLGLDDRNDTMSYIRCPNLRELGEWLKKCKPLLLQGDIFYFPDILVHRVKEGRYTGEDEWDEEESIGPLCNLIIENKKLVDTTSTNIVKSNLIQPLLQLDLPYIENVDLETFSKITSDEKEAFHRFRDFLRLKFLDLKHNEGSESFDANLVKIGIELRDGVRCLSSDFDVIKRKSAFQVTNAIIAATTATLVALNSAAFGVLPQALGTSGGLIGIAIALEQYLSEKHKLRDASCYYLWLFSRRESR